MLMRYAGRWFSAFAFIVIFALAISVYPVWAEAPADYAPGVVLVGFHTLGAYDLDSLPHVVATMPAIALCQLRVPVGEEQAAIARLRADPRVAFAELDYAVHATDGDIPDDPGYDRQWALRAIGAPAAWSVVTGTADVIIAVVDSGITLNHPDLAAKIWTNPGELPANGRDDDGNGKVDDVQGWHFYHFRTSAGYVPAEDALVMDDFGHGTHVAGTAAAATNNGLGIAGVSWGARLMAVKVLDAYGTGWYSDVAAGIIYAADNGAKIINLSLGGASASDTLCAAAAYAWRKGCLVVAATGNSGGPVYYPAACEHVLAVAAIDRADQRPSFSNAGLQVDLAAPGVDLYSTWPWQGGYFTKTGTSVAVPLVSGVAALVESRWPALSADAVALQITRTAVDIAGPGWDAYTGWGKLDAGRAVAVLAVPADLWVSLDVPRRAGPGQTFPYQIVYGNRSGLDARDVRIGITWPPEVLASGPPTHEVPILAAWSGAYTLTFTATLASCVPLGAALAYTATITSANEDLDPADNVVEGVLRVGYQACLPMLLKP
jgi:thermitase